MRKFYTGCISNFAFSPFPELGAADEADDDDDDVDEDDADSCFLSSEFISCTGGGLTMVICVSLQSDR